MRDRPAVRDGQAGRPHFGPMPTLEREIRDFDRDVIARSRERLVLAEFWAPWCSACRRLHPALENVTARQAGRAELVSINIEMHPQVAAHAVRGLPTVRAYGGGRALGELNGVVPEAEIEHWVASLLSQPPHPRVQ